ncbi:MAG: ACP S-malonyltransferase [Turicibacter sp.]|nr:ACP S-malonyltransferase [Turicibacter sp.]
MSKIAFLFSGQGAQYVGMGQSFYESSETARQLMDEANNILPFDLKEICFEDSGQLINQTTYTQPAIFVVSQMALAVLQEAGIKADVVAGFSLGEYSALCAADTFNFTEGVSLVAKRGELMGVSSHNGKMAALLGVDSEKAQAICDEASSKGIVELANLNCPGQIVIGGESEAVDYACNIAKDYGAKRAVVLPVSGPFHTSLLEETAQVFAQVLEDKVLNIPQTPIVLNVLGDYYQSELNLKDLMVAQMATSVKWESSIRQMIDNGINTFIEIGPGKTLSGFVKKIDRSVKVLNVEDMDSLQKTLTALTA